MVQRMTAQPGETECSSKAMPRRWLVISHAYNMDGRAASLTVTDKVPLLLEAGIELQVLSAISGRRDPRVQHHQLLPMGPSALRFDFRHYISQQCGRGLRYRILTVALSCILAPAILLERLAVRLSSNWSWALTAVVAGRMLARRHSFDLIYSSGGEWSAHWAAAMLHRACGIPWIAEIHDPLVVRDGPQDDGTSPRRTREGRFLQGLEARVCSEATAVWWFTDAALHWARLRNPRLGERGFVVRPGAAPPLRHWPRERGKAMRIGHFGLLSTTRPIGGFLEAMRRMLDAHPDARVELHLFGGVPAAADLERIPALGLQNLVHLHGRVERDPRGMRSGRDQIHERMQQQDVLLLLHGHHEGCVEYIPSKLYEYLWARRPVLALTHHNPELDQLVAQYGGTVASDGDVEAISRALASLWMRWKNGDLPDSDQTPLDVRQAVSRILQHVLVAINSGKPVVL